MSTRRSRVATTGEPEQSEGLSDAPGRHGSEEAIHATVAGPWHAVAAALGSAGADVQMTDGQQLAEGEGEGEGDEYSFDEDDDDDGEYGEVLEMLDEDEDEDEVDGEDDGEDGVEVSVEGVRTTRSGGGIMSLLFGRHRGLLAAQEVLRDLPRLPLTPSPLTGDLAAAVNNATRGFDIGQANRIWSCLDSSCDAMLLPTISTAQQLVRHLEANDISRAADNANVPRSNSNSSGTRRSRSSPGGPSSSTVQAAAAAAGAAAAPSSRGGSVLTRLGSRRRAAADVSGSRAAAAAAAEPAGDAAYRDLTAAAAVGSSSGNSSSGSSSSGFSVINTACLLLKREVSLGRQEGFSRAQQRHLNCCRTLPMFPQKVRDNMHSRAYIGQYSGSGDFYIAAYQDRRVRLYDTQRNWALRKDVTTRMTRWTITDTTMSPDQRLLVYASISPVAFVVNVGSSYDVVESQANITEVHEPLAFDGRYAAGAEARQGRRGRVDGSDEDDDEDWDGSSFGIWSIAWSPQGGQLIAGTNNNAVYIYDITSKRCLTKLTNHQDDVNAVAYLREGDPHLIVSGSDDHLLRVWDIRDRSGTLRAPQGVLVGHTEGLTHVCPKGDGFHLISNCKDQTIKLWDIRAAVSPDKAAAAGRNRPRIPRWDYRWEEYPASGYAVRHPDDVSLMTYRGHAVLQTLIRAYFSPAHTTGQRYIYAGNSDGDILVWDVVSGKQVATLQYHESLVRDCSWHPFEPELTTASWDGRIISWGVEAPTKLLSKHAD